MTQSYIDRLIELAEDLFNYPSITTTDLLEAERHQAIFTAKLNYLLGYIMALKERPV